VNLNDLLTDQSSMLTKMLTVRIRLSLMLHYNIWDVWIDETEFADALLNICINAMHAMEKMESNAELKIQTDNTTLDADTATELDLSIGDYVKISVTDNGCGMTSAVVDRIFEPFFTTKDNKGTGLGLSQVYGFIQRSKGTLRVHSVPDEGSQFVMYFPRFRGSLVEQDTEQSKQKVQGGNESILIVDDEQALRDLADELLSKQGYQTLVAESGDAALELLQNNAIDLVLSDIIMPNMNGYQLAHQIKQLYPMIKIQLVSGYTDKTIDSASKEELADHILYKPYQPEALYRCIRDVLDK